MIKSTGGFRAHQFEHVAATKQPPSDTAVKFFDQALYVVETLPGLFRRLALSKSLDGSFKAFFDGAIIRLIPFAAGNAELTEAGIMEPMLAKAAADPRQISDAGVAGQSPAGPEDLTENLTSDETIRAMRSHNGLDPETGQSIVPATAPAVAATSEPVEEEEDITASW
jgi:hypothetical protein